VKRSDKAFDSVRLMRTLRDALSKQMQGLTFEQQHKLIKERLGAHSGNMGNMGTDTPIATQRP